MPQHPVASIEGRNMAVADSLEDDVLSSKTKIAESLQARKTPSNIQFGMTTHDRRSPRHCSAIV